VICGRVADWTGSPPRHRRESLRAGKTRDRCIYYGIYRHKVHKKVCYHTSAPPPNIEHCSEILRTRLGKTSVLSVCLDFPQSGPLQRREQNRTTFKSYQYLPSPATTSFSLNTLGGDSFFPSSLTVINKAGNTTRPSG